jgi:hypothetical protein
LNVDASKLICRGKYDEEYLQYLRKLLESMAEYGLVAYVVSPHPAQRTEEVTALKVQAVHQDVWSRYCGGVRRDSER